MHKEKSILDTEIVLDAIDETAPLIAGRNTPLFDLSADGRWRLAADRLQWVVQENTSSPDAARPVFAGRSFVSTRKDVLERELRRLNVPLTEAAQQRIISLPNTFREFQAAWPNWRWHEQRTDTAHMVECSVTRTDSTAPRGYNVRQVLSHHLGGWKPCKGKPQCPDCAAEPSPAKAQGPRRIKKGDIAGIKSAADLVAYCFRQWDSVWDADGSLRSWHATDYDGGPLRCILLFRDTHGLPFSDDEVAVAFDEVKDAAIVTAAKKADKRRANEENPAPGVIIRATQFEELLFQTALKERLRQVF